jgi:hypothetical protein
MMATHAGMSTEIFEKIVKDWIATAKHPLPSGLSREMVQCRRDSLTCVATASRPSSFPVAVSSSCVVTKKPGIPLNKKWQ